MTANDWTKLRDWLFRVFPAAEARTMLAEQVAEARGLGLTVPDEIVEAATSR